MSKGMQVNNDIRKKKSGENRNRETETYGQNFTKPPSELLEGEEVYEIENILNHRRRG